MTAAPQAAEQPALTTAAVVATWLPVALSWIIMTSELVITTAGLARMALPELNLAAWGIAFALTVIVQSPAQTLLPTGAALASDARSYARLRTYALRLLLALVALQVVVALTPLYTLVMRGIGAPAGVVGIARPALLLMAAYLFGTGFRRFLQGVIIRYGDPRVVVYGSLIRLGCVAAVMAAAAVSGAVPGVMAAAAAIVTGVLAEAAYTWLKVGPVVAGPVQRQPVGQAMTFRRFYAFVWPLVVMTLLTMLVQTFVSVALARLPLPLESLAVWPVVWGFLMLWQSPGMAFTEVVISLVRRPGGVPALRRVTFVAAAVLTVALATLAATPLARLWFGSVAGLKPELAAMASGALWLGALLPGVRVLLAWYQGVIMFSEQTRAIMESVLVFLAVGLAGLAIGGAVSDAPGIYVGMVAFFLAFAAQAVWLAYRSRKVTAAAVAFSGGKP